MAANTLREWFSTPLGQYLLEKERAYLDEVTPDLRGRSDPLLLEIVVEPDPVVPLS